GLGLDVHGGIEIGATKSDAGIHRRGPQGQVDLLAGVQADTGGTNGVFQRALFDHWAISRRTRGGPKSREGNSSREGWQAPPGILHRIGANLSRKRGLNARRKTRHRPGTGTGPGGEMADFGGRASSAPRRGVAARAWRPGGEPPGGSRDQSAWRRRKAGMSR